MNQYKGGVFGLIKNIVFPWCKKVKKPEDKAVKVN
jgi:hypothetical protein